MTIEKKNNVLTCIPQDVKHVCFPVKLDPHRNINLETAPLCTEIQKELGKLSDEYKDIFCLHQCDRGKNYYMWTLIQASILPFCKNCMPY